MNTMFSNMTAAPEPEDYTGEVRFLGGKNPRLHTDEVLIALSLAAVTNENAKKALEQLPALRGCQVHTSVMLSEVDIKIFKNRAASSSAGVVMSVLSGCKRANSFSEAVCDSTRVEAGAGAAALR